MSNNCRTPLCRGVSCDRCEWGYLEGDSSQSECLEVSLCSLQRTQNEAFLTGTDVIMSVTVERTHADRKRREKSWSGLLPEKTHVHWVTAHRWTNIIILIWIFHRTKTNIKTLENILLPFFLFHLSSIMLGCCTCKFPSHQWPRWWAVSWLLSQWWRSPHPGALVTPCHPGTDLLAQRCPPGDPGTTLHREKVLMLQLLLLFLVGQVSSSSKLPVSVWAKMLLVLPI